MSIVKLSLLKRAWNEIPDIVGGAVVALIGITMAIGGCINYSRKNGDNRTYKRSYVVMRDETNETKKGDEYDKSTESDKEGKLGTNGTKDECGEKDGKKEYEYGSKVTEPKKQGEIEKNGEANETNKKDDNNWNGKKIEKDITDECGPDKNEENSSSDGKTIEQKTADGDLIWKILPERDNPEEEKFKVKKCDDDEEQEEDYRKLIRPILYGDGRLL